MQALGVRVLGEEDEVVVSMESGSITSTLRPNNYFCVNADCSSNPCEQAWGHGARAPSSKGARAKLWHEKLGL